MKKSLFTIALLFIGFNVFAQQAQFGFTAGYSHLNVKVKDGSNSGLSFTEDASGYYVGMLADVAISGGFHIQPEVLYTNAEDSDQLYIPVLAKIYISDSGFHVLGGPQANIILEDMEGSGINSFGLDLSFGAGYDINTHFFIDARYSFEITNRISDDIPNPGDASARINTLNVGVGYKF